MHSKSAGDILSCLFQQEKKKNPRICKGLISLIAIGIHGLHRNFQNKRFFSPSCDIPEEGNLHKQGKGKEKEDTRAELKESESEGEDGLGHKHLGSGPDLLRGRRF